MAFLSAFVSTQFNKPWLPFLSALRMKQKKRKFHRVFRPWHLDPIPSRVEQERMEASGELEPLHVIPVKPAPSDMTTSLFDDPFLKKFNNLVMRWSERTEARTAMRNVFAEVKRAQLKKYHSTVDEAEKQLVELSPYNVLVKAVENCQPTLTVIPIKKGGITYQVPIPVTQKKSTFMAMKWLISAGRDKERPVTFIQQMTREILDAFNNEGRVVRRKQDLHKLCENNKAYAHYRWS